SWQMMLHRHTITTYLYVTDPNIGQDVQMEPEMYLSRKQISRMGWRPDMVRQFAHYLAQRLPQYGSQPLQVEVRMFVSINGRKPALNFRSQCQSCRRATNFEAATLAAGNSRPLTAAWTGLFRSALRAWLRKRTIDGSRHTGGK